MVNITMKMKGAGSLVRSVDLFDKANVKDLSGSFPKVLKIMEKHRNAIFKSSGKALDRGRRSPLKPSTVRARQKRYGYYRNSPNKPGTLRRTGNLQENRGSRIKKLKLTWRPNAKYAKYHHLARKNKRPIFEFGSKINAEIIRSFQVEINKKIGIRNLRGK